MQDFVRIGSYVWPYRRLFVLSVVCAVIVSLFWAMNLSFAFPVVKILFQNDSLHGYVDTEIQTLESSIRVDTATGRDPCGASEVPCSDSIPRQRTVAQPFATDESSPLISAIYSA